MSWTKFLPSKPILFIPILALLCSPLLAEPGSGTGPVAVDEAKVKDALGRLEWALINRANQHNERNANWDVSYGEMDRLAMQKQQTQEQINDYEKLVRLFGAMGAEKEMKTSQSRLDGAKADLRLYQKEYNKLKKEGQDEYYPEHQKEAYDRRTELMRIATNKFSEATSGLNEAETIKFMEGVLEYQPNNRITGAVDKRLVFGPEYHINELVTELRRRALDVLADWGTKEAWEVVARAAAKQPYLAVKQTAIQHLMGEMTAEKAQALAATSEGSELLQKITALHQQRPHTFRQGTKYLDLQNPTAEPITFEGRENHPEFRKKGAKERFVPVGDVNTGKSGFRDAARKQVPANRWAKMASRFRRSTRPATPKPEPVAPVETAQTQPPTTTTEVVPPLRNWIAERAAAMPLGLPAPETSATEVVPPAETESRESVEKTGEEVASKPKTGLGSVWNQFLDGLRRQTEVTRISTTGKNCGFANLRPPTNRRPYE